MFTTTPSTLFRLFSRTENALDRINLDPTSVVVLVPVTMTCPTCTSPLVALAPTGLLVDAKLAAAESVLFCATERRFLDMDDLSVGRIHAIAGELATSITNGTLWTQADLATLQLHAGIGRVVPTDVTDPHVILPIGYREICYLYKAEARVVQASMDSGQELAVGLKGSPLIRARFEPGDRLPAVLERWDPTDEEYRHKARLRQEEVLAALKAYETGESVSVPPSRGCTESLLEFVSSTYVEAANNRNVRLLRRRRGISTG